MSFLFRALIIVSEDLQNLEQEIRSKAKANPTAREAQVRINECLTRLTQATQAFRVRHRILFKQPSLLTL